MEVIWAGVGGRGRVLKFKGTLLQLKERWGTMLEKRLGSVFERERCWGDCDFYAAF